MLLGKRLYNVLTIGTQQATITWYSIVPIKRTYYGAKIIKNKK